MGILDDTAIFTAVIQQGGFSHAAKHLGLSNGLISRRISHLEAELGVTLLKRTTRQLQLTPEGELYWDHAQRIQQELDSARSLIKSLSEKPKGEIRVTAPLFIGKTYLMPIILKFMANFPEISIELLLSDERLDPIKEKFDLLIRGAGFMDKAMLKDSSMKMKSLTSFKIGLYVSPDYLGKFGEPQTPEDLLRHRTISYLHHPDHQNWTFNYKGKPGHIMLPPPYFSCNDTESRVAACAAGHGIARLTEYAALEAVKQKKLRQVLQQYDWGGFQLYAVYAQQQLPKRTRLLLDFITANIKNI